MSPIESSRAPKERSLTRGQRALIVGILLALAFYLIETGLVELAIARNVACRLALSRMRLSPDPNAACQAEWQVMFLHSAARGFVWLIRPSASAFEGWAVMGTFYALLGGACSQLKRPWSFIVFLATHVGLVSILAGLAHIAQFIAT